MPSELSFTVEVSAADVALLEELACEVDRQLALPLAADAADRLAEALKAALGSSEGAVRLVWERPASAAGRTDHVLARLECTERVRDLLAAIRAGEFGVATHATDGTEPAAAAVAAHAFTLPLAEAGS